MRSTFFALVCGAALISASAVLADQPQPPMQPQNVSAQNSDPVTCHYYDSEGTLVKGECHTQHEWNEKMRLEQESIREFQLRALQFHN
jgi:hypothetical protein